MKSVIVYVMIKAEKPPKANIYRNPCMWGFNSTERQSGIRSL